MLRKTFILASSNIKKAKGHTFTLFLLFLIAALLLNTGLLVVLNFGNYFTELTNELKTSDVYYIIPDILYNNEAEKYVREHDSVTATQKTEALILSSTIDYNNDTRGTSFIFYNSEAERNMSRWKTIGEHEELSDMDIYLPYIFQLEGKYRIGDTLTITNNDNPIEFTVKGFVDDGYFSSTDTGLLCGYMNADTYQKVSKQVDKEQSLAHVIFADLKEYDSEIESGLRDLLGISNTSLMGNASNMLISIDISLLELSRTMMASMIALMLVLFSVIIVAVCLVVVRFRINNSIEEDIVKIGSLKSIGYTSRQIIASIVLQFLLTAGIGSLVGIALSYPIIPIISDIFAVQSGLKWEQGFDPLISGATLAVMVLVVALISLISARHVKKLNPIDALRGENATRKVRKNRFPLEKSKASLPVALANKTVAQNVRQNISIGFIIAVVAFACTFAVVMFYNAAIDTSTFAEVPGIERSDAMVVFSPENDNEKVVNEIENMPQVNKVLFIDQVDLYIDEDPISTYVVDDYSLKKTVTVYDGRYPKNEKEIVLAGILSERLNKGIGDTVSVKFGEKQLTCVVTGLSQGAQMGGLNASVSYDSMIYLFPEFKPTNLYIYLSEDENSDEFVKELEKKYNDKQASAIIDMVKEFEQGMGSYTSIVSIVGSSILVVTMFIVILILYFVINSSIIRRKRELGIQKAIGFTTFQLMAEITLGFLPSVFIGTCIGCLIGAFESNNIMSLAMGAMGIMRANFIVNPMWVVCFGIFIVLLSFVTSMLITWRVRKISAYALVTE